MVKRWRVCQLLLEVANTHYDSTILEIDYDGEVGCVIQTIAEGLIACLDQTEHLDAEPRRRWVETLYNAILNDIDLVGMDYAWPTGDAITDLTTEENWTWLYQIRISDPRNDQALHAGHQ